MAKIAILGFGTVGGGVAQVLAQNAAGIAQKAGQTLEVGYILDRKEFPDSPLASRVVHDF